ncbi:DinB family protein [Kitasatospora purpeofusca]|uniref:DinB family protein n=1 Tax=Kitasatospora purpeofusca TaxID=67352 RepID=UPI0036D31962
MTSGGAALPDGERADLLQTLDTHRGFLRYTVRDLGDEQAARRTTASELCLGGLIKHVSAVEARWMRFAVGGAAAMEAAEPGGGAGAAADWAAQFRMAEGETLAGLLAAYERVAAETDALVASLPDLDRAHALPAAPWFEPGATWSVRRVLLHVIAETAQHAGHADIIRESLDGARTMG